MHIPYMYTMSVQFKVLYDKINNLHQLMCVFEYVEYTITQLLGM
jgi:hypothetical protein